MQHFIIASLFIMTACSPVIDHGEYLREGGQTISNLARDTYSSITGGSSDDTQPEFDARGRRIGAPPAMQQPPAVAPRNEAVSTQTQPKQTALPRYVSEPSPLLAYRAAKKRQQGPRSFTHKPVQSHVKTSHVIVAVPVEPIKSTALADDTPIDTPSRNALIDDLKSVIAAPR